MFVVTEDVKQSIKHKYLVERKTLRKIAREIGTDHHRIKRILNSMNIVYDRTCTIKECPPMSEETKQKLRKIPHIGVKATKEQTYKNMAAHLRFNVDLDFLKQFDDLEKLKTLNHCIINRFDRFDVDDEWYKSYLYKFYYDENFNKIYNKYINTHDRYMKPSLDHIIPKSKGGTNDLSNLQFLSWFENRCKNDLSQDGWNDMKTHINDYFV